MPHASQDLQALRLRASRRGGVVSAQDLRECGFSAPVVRRRISEGSWQRWGRAVLLSAPEARPRSDAMAVPQLSDLGLAWAQQLTYGPSAAVSGAVAMRLAGWDLPTTIRIVVGPGKPRVGVPDVVISRRVPEKVLRLKDGLQLVSAMDALLDSLIALGPSPGADLLDAALQRRVVTPEALADAVRGRSGSGRRGARTLGVLVQRALSGSRSEAEHRMSVLLKRSRTGPWVANLPFHDDSGRLLAEIDFAHEGLRIAIEVDGRAHHSDRRSFERDRARQNLLVVRGWLVLRFTWEQITQRPGEVLAAIAAAIAMRLAG